MGFPWGTGVVTPPVEEGPVWVAAYLEGDLCQAARALDVEAKDGQAQVGLILHGLFASIELLALIDVFSTCLTSVGRNRDSSHLGTLVLAGGTLEHSGR